MVEIIEVIGTAIAGIALLGICIYLLVLWRRTRGANAAEREDAIVKLAEAKSLLAPVLLQLVTTAEQAWGSGTGTFKFGDVLGKATAALANCLPENVRALIPASTIAQTLTTWIEDALAAAKKKWEANPDIVTSTLQAEIE
ncbi:MAG: hypothetical protein LBC83_08705 [Oscillospiraceae bacterium]|jgi:hypothetical protein|nr:hypothetical protein [Oscillospiraceae bacterium]